MKTRGLLLAVAALLVIGLPATASARGALTAQERRQIDATLDTFINHAVKRQDVGAAYDSVTPRFRLGMSRKEWDKGSIPGFPYPAAGRTFHGWTVEYRTGNELGIEIVLQPRKGSGVGAGSFPMTLKKIHGRWLVDSMVPGAFFAPEGKQARVVGTFDFGPGNGSPDPAGSSSRINSDFAYVPFAVFGFILLVIGAAAGVAVLRHRRYVATSGGGLPPLPVRARRDSQHGA